EQKTRPFTLPNLPLSSLSNSRAPLPISSMGISPDNVQSVQFQNGRCTLDGRLVGTTPVSLSHVAKIRGTSNGTVINLTELDGTPFHPFEGPAPIGFPDLGGCDWHINMTQFGHSSQTQYDVDTTPDTFVPHLGSIQANGIGSGNYVGVLSWISPPSHPSGSQVDLWKIPNYGSSITEATHLAPSVYPPGFGEVLVFFMSKMPGPGAYNLPCLLPQEYISHLASEQAPTIGEAALLHYVDPDTGRNLGEFKAYPDGFLTCVPNGASSGPQQLPINGVFVFVSWVSRFYQLKPVGTV
uniref:58 kd capsid protein n=1 Tax=Norwalk virus TaxID=11983 RepID=UPI000181D12E|nr:Chain A, kd capsid protein [unidentified]2ZL5_B Chain B, kd capsid protein [unidentified]